MTELMPDSVSPRPCIGVGHASDLFHKYYNHHPADVVEIEELKAHEDRNFKITLNLPSSSPTSQSTHSRLCQPLAELPSEGYDLGLVTFIMKVTLSSAADVYLQIQTLKKQFKLMNYVRQKGFRCSTPIVNKHGNHCEIEMILDKDGCTQQVCIVYVLTYMAGHTLFDLYIQTGIPDQVLEETGMLLALWRKDLKDYPGDNFISSCWALDNTVDVKDFVNSIGNSSKEELVIDVLTAFEENVLYKLESLENGILHGDFHDENLICLTARSNDTVPSRMGDYLSSSGGVHNEEDTCCSLTTGDAVSQTSKLASPANVRQKYGIIDFSDSGHGPFIFDLATSVAFFMISAECMPDEDEITDAEYALTTSVHSSLADGSGFAYKVPSLEICSSLTTELSFIDAGGRFLAGYSKVCALSPVEWDVLYLSVCAAYCRELVVAEHDFREQGSSNSYLLTTAYNGWKQLKLLWELGKEEVLTRWRTACGNECTV